MIQKYLNFLKLIFKIRGLNQNFFRRYPSKNYFDNLH